MGGIVKGTAVKKFDVDVNPPATFDLDQGVNRLLVTEK